MAATAAAFALTVLGAGPASADNHSSVAPREQGAQYLWVGTFGHQGPQFLTEGDFEH